jgi:Trehalase
MYMEILSEQCKEVLKNNDQGSFTAPSSFGLYPHQWLWDSCFAAIGWSHLDTARAEAEIDSLLNGQWDNGMIPHMLFNKDPRYQRDMDSWQSSLSSHSPSNAATSGITQPPLLAEAVKRIGQQLHIDHRKTYYKKVLPKLVKYHQWFYSERDPKGNGLVVQVHPYETGLDNTPPWMKKIRQYHRPRWIKAIELLHLEKIINVARRDTRKLPPEQRMANIDALLIWDNIRMLKKVHYDIDEILHLPLFFINDVSFNSILVRNNTILREIAKEARVKLPDELLKNMKLSELGLNTLWSETFNVYLSQDFTTEKLLQEPTIASLMPIYAGTIEKEKADKVVAIMMNSKTFWLKHPLPSLPKNLKDFDENRYWQGPTWINMNWMLIDGLQRMGYQKEADALRSHTIELVEDNGLWEYYNPITGKGLGSPEFTWTAALTLDLLNS